MYAHHGGRSHRRRAIEFLARESQMPVMEAAQLYDDARARLELGARSRGPLDIVAARTDLPARDAFASIAGDSPVARTRAL